jgi:hypothetical protein
MRHVEPMLVNSATVCLQEIGLAAPVVVAAQMQPGDAPAEPPQA